MVFKDKDFQEILIRISPTILGVKPAEILNVKLGSLDKCRRCFQGLGEFEFIEIKDFPNISRRQLFFYHKTCLEEVLTQKAIQKFLQQLGYPFSFNMELYLDILIAKLQSCIFPHEIGVFLGYPLKDVLGYMGLTSLKLVDVKGWQYYGNGNLSILQYKKFCKAREVFRCFLEKGIFEV
ncbi:MAG: hypothetical protein JM58_18305 [Peptococcaceae bacterium BICA1-8]|nr:MAG: hypothetical protein JM58_18305 [Peptococcaceae bacterium BICA1-8]